MLDNLIFIEVYLKFKNYKKNMNYILICKMSVSVNRIRKRRESFFDSDVLG